MEPKTLSAGAKAGIAIAIVAILAVGAYFIFSGGDSADVTDVTATSTVMDNGGTTICTMDARMCPDGSYVGRTGPNCEFVCPNGGSVDDVQSPDYPADILK
jgi:hypothetical protein